MKICQAVLLHMLIQIGEIQCGVPLSFLLSPEGAEGGMNVGYHQLVILPHLAACRGQLVQYNAEALHPPFLSPQRTATAVSAF